MKSSSYSQQIYLHLSTFFGIDQGSFMEIYFNYLFSTFGILNLSKTELYNSWSIEDLSVGLYVSIFYRTSTSLSSKTSLNLSKLINFLFFRFFSIVMTDLRISFSLMNVKSFSAMLKRLSCFTSRSF